MKNFLRDYIHKKELSTIELLAVSELAEFFSDEPYKTFLDVFYINRYSYKNRFPSNRSLFKYLSKTLYVQEPTLYIMRKEIIYKSAMIFYKYKII